MELTKKQIKYLKGLGHNLNSLYQIGKFEIGETQFTLYDNALRAHELIKIHVLKSVATKKEELGAILAERLRATVIEIKGNMILLFRRNINKPAIKFPKWNE